MDRQRLFRPLHRLVRLTVAVTLANMGVFAAAVPAYAQEGEKRPSTQQPPQQPPLSAVWRGATIAADTGRMLPAHRDFSRYDTPEQCVRAVIHMQGWLYRARSSDTMAYVPQADTFATVVKDTAQQCYDQIDVAKVPTHQLGALMRLQLALGKDAEASATADRLLKTPMSPPDRLRARYEVPMAYLTAKPVRIDAAIAAAQQLDSAESTAYIERAFVHAALLQEWNRRFNTAQILKESEAVLAIAERIPVAERIQILLPLLNTYSAYTNALAFDQGIESLTKIVPRAMEIVGTLANGEGRQVVEQFIEGAKNRAEFMGKRMPPIPARWTVNGMADAQADVPMSAQAFAQASPQWPASGRVTLVSRVTPDRFTGAWFAVLRRFAERYSTQGLDVVLVTQNRGFTPGSLVQTPEEEVKSLKRYFIEVYKIPAALLVQETEFFTRADGVRSALPTKFQRDYPFSTMLIGRNGEIQWVGNASSSDEALLEAYIKRAIGGGASAAHQGNALPDTSVGANQ